MFHVIRFVFIFKRKYKSKKALYFSRLNWSSTIMMAEYSKKMKWLSIATGTFSRRFHAKVYYNLYVKDFLFKLYFILFYVDNEERATVVRVLSRWWSLNFQHFDSLTPRPIYHTYSKYPGVRCLREVSNHLVFDIYCQVWSI